MIVNLVTTDSDFSFEGDIRDDVIIGSQHDDSLGGGPGDDFIQGNHHDDVIHGDSGDDFLRGGSHDDLLDGGSNNDSLDGGMGQDTLIGRDGADNFIFTTIDSVDVIVDFNADEGDKIIFYRSTGIDKISDLIVHIRPSEYHHEVSDHYHHGASNNHHEASDHFHGLGLDRVSSISFEGEIIMEFDRIISFDIEDFRFI